MTLSTPNEDTLRVVFVIYENLLATSVTLPMELFRAADNLQRAQHNKKRHSKPLKKLAIQLLSTDGQTRNSHTGLGMPIDSAIDNVEDADIIFLPALWRNPFHIVKKNERVCGWLKKMFSRETTLIAGVGTGCCFMAEAGLLDNKVATTHWYYFDDFKKHYPKVNLNRQYFITQSGRLYCTGSVNTLADLSTHFINHYYGPAISSEVERHFFHDIRQSYDKLALSDDNRQSHPDETIIDCQQLIQSQLSQNIDLDKLAERAGMSRRNFDRRFKAALGLSPLNYQQQQRMNYARDLLKNTNLDVAEIMYESGYQDSGYFSKLFKKHHGASPRQYRMTVRAKLFQLNQ